MQNTVKFLIGRELKFNRHSRGDFWSSRFNNASNLYSKDCKGHYSCVNAIEFSNSSDFMISAGDDKRVLLWDVNKDIFTSETTIKNVMNAQHHSNILTLSWDNEDKKIFSGGNDHQLIVHDAETKEVCDIFLHENAVLCISVHPQQSQIFATACESGQISLYDLRLSNSDPIILASSLRNESRTDTDFYMSSDSSASSSSSMSEKVYSTGGAFQSCHFNPVDTNLIAVSNEISGVSLIDIRMNSTVLRYRTYSNKGNDWNRSSTNQNVMSVSFNRYGTQLIALRNKLRPVIYETNNTSPIFMFDAPGFSNSCTLKSCCFAGDSDQYLATGSDNFALYCWKIPSKQYSSIDHVSSLICEPHLKLQGHRSIVNQCRYNSKYNLLASSGVEKIVKVWSPYELPGETTGGLLGRKEEYAPKRKLYTFTELFRQNSTQAATGTEPITDPNDLAVLSYAPVIRNIQDSTVEESLEEDRIMIAFFDSQVRRQRRIEEGSSESFTSGTDNDKKKKFKRLAGSLSNQTSISDTSDSQGLPHIDLNMSVSNDESDSADSESLESFTSGEETESDQEEFEFKNKKGYLKSTKRTLIPLRDRLRNLRHRRSLNLTETTDFKNVLDSLKVIENSEKNDSSSKFFNKTSNFTSASNNEIETIQSINDNVSPGTSSSFSNVKSLNEQKRKIEKNEDEISAQIANDSSVDIDESSTEKIHFKKLKRSSKMAKLSAKSARSKNDELSSSE